MEIAMCRNAAKVPLPNGGAQSGHVGITVTALVYAQLSPDKAWVNPIPPSPTFTVPPAGTNALLEQNLRDQYKQRCYLFQTQQNVSQALKKQINDAIPKEYLDEIHHLYLNLLPLSIPDIVAHLCRQPSSNVAPEDVDEARRLSVETQKYSLEEELTRYFKRLQDYQKYAAHGGEQVTDNHLINIAIRHICATGQFNNKDCQDWHA